MAKITKREEAARVRAAIHQFHSLYIRNSEKGIEDNFEVFYLTPGCFI